MGSHRGVDPIQNCEAGGCCRSSRVMGRRRSITPSIPRCSCLIAWADVSTPFGSPRHACFDHALRLRSWRKAGRCWYMWSGGRDLGVDAGQLGLWDRHTNSLFARGPSPPKWAQHLWGSLSLKDMIGAIARGDLTPVRLGAGLAQDQIFFKKACFGLLASHLPQLHGVLSKRPIHSRKVGK